MRALLTVISYPGFVLRNAGYFRAFSVWMWFVQMLANLAVACGLGLR